MLDRILVVNAGNQPFVGDEQQGHPRRLINTAALGLDDAIFNLIAHAETVPPADPVGLQHHLHGILEADAVQRHRLSFVELHRHFFPLDRNIVTPGRDTHDRLDDRDPAIEPLEIFGFVGGAKDV